MEDEPRDGGDHVSALRIEALAISPDTRIGEVDPRVRAARQQRALRVSTALAMRMARRIFAS